jgi:hypothetical protein
MAGIIFNQITEIERGDKTQTRRAVKEGETWTYGLSEIVIGRGAGTWTESAKINATNYNIPLKMNLLYPIYAVYTPSGRKKWRVGDIVPMIPKPRQKGVGYVRIKSIRLERLGDISERDALEEGILKGTDEGYDGYEQRCHLIKWDVYSYQNSQDYLTAVEAYSALWESINGIGSWQKQQNDFVWVLEFEYIGKVKPMKAKTK